MSNFTADDESIYFLTEEEIEAPRLAMQAKEQEVGRLAFLRRIYHQAPDDMFEKIMVSCIAWAKSRGERVIMRLVNKRLAALVQGVEEHATKLQEVGAFLGQKGATTLPASSLKRCRRIETVQIRGTDLRSLEGCPIGLKVLIIRSAYQLADLSPLASCSMIKRLFVNHSHVSDIAVVSLMPLLEEFTCAKSARASIVDLSPLSSCLKLKHLTLDGNSYLEDLGPLSACTQLEKLDISRCAITGLFPLSRLVCLRELDVSENEELSVLVPLSSCLSLEVLDISLCIEITSLAPLSPLVNLTVLRCTDISGSLSTLPLATCVSLRTIFCRVGEEDEVGNDLKDLEELKVRLPLLRVTEIIELDSEDDDDDKEVDYYYM